MTPQSAKAKGRRAVERVREMLLAVFPALTPGDIRMKTTSEPGTDLSLSPAAELCLPFSVEVKNTERFQVWATIDQAKANAAPGRPFLVFFTRNREDLYVILDARTFLDGL